MKYLYTISLFVLICLTGLHAQESVLSSGGNASGTGGTVSYSVGQVVYTTSTGTTGSVAQGVQQPYEISTTVGIEITNINLELSVYPNPTTDILTLKVADTDLSTMTFQLFDLQGKLVVRNKLTSDNTSISMENLPTSTYFLKVIEGNTPLKTFKIIKT